VDGKDVGRTPGKLDIATGRHSVEVTTGGDIGRFQINVSSGGANKWCYVFETGKTVTGSCP